MVTESAVTDEAATPRARAAEKSMMVAGLKCEDRRMKCGRTRC